jgi:hypothetical protein
MLIIPALRRLRLRRKDGDFEARLNDKVRVVSKKKLIKNKKTKRRGRELNMKLDTNIS